MTSGRSFLNILVVEDSATQAEQLRFLLEGNGHAVTVAGHGREALAIISRALPDVVISDIVMPEMDGYALCSALRADPVTADLPVILLTSLANTRDVLRALQCGADHFITKPYRDEALCDRLENIRQTIGLRRDSCAEGRDLLIFQGERITITTDRRRILDLLISTYEATVQKQQDLGTAQRDIQESHLRLEIALEEAIEAKRQAEEALAELARKEAHLAWWHRELTMIHDIEQLITHAELTQELLGTVSGHLAGSGLFGISGDIRVCLLDDGFLSCCYDESGVTLECAVIPLGEFICGTSLMRGTLRYVAPADQSICRRGTVGAGRMAVPLLANEKPVGVLCCATTSGFTIDARQSSLLESLGRHLGMAVENRRLFEETLDLALHDPLTGLANRRLLEIGLKGSIARAKRFHGNFAIIILDIDQFKNYNDTHGHDAGDLILRNTALLLKERFRETDLAVRYGGDEFMVLLNDADLDEATAVAEKFRIAMSEQIGMTVSIGIARYCAEFSAEAIIHRADQALYAAKSSGRNRVVAAS